MTVKPVAVMTLPGPLSFDTVVALEAEGYQQMKQHQRLNIDLSQVTESDSAGLALLVAWCRFAQQNHYVLRLINMPTFLQALMKVANLDQVLSEFLP